MMFFRFATVASAAAVALAALSAGGPAASTPSRSIALPAESRSAVLVAQTGGIGAGAQSGGPSVPAGFSLEVIARVRGARELTATPNGDLIAGTDGAGVYLIPGAESVPGEPILLAHFDDPPAAGVALGADALYVGTQLGVWRLSYRSGERSAGQPVRIASVRPGGSRGHRTTSVAVAGNRLYFSVGSSCNVCNETDPTRASIFVANLDGSDVRAAAKHIRNAIALAVAPGAHAVWAGVAGQDELEHGHPYEIFDPFSERAAPADYGWPLCYENRRPVHPGDDCSQAVVPEVVFPAYDTPIGAAFYPLHASGRYAFPREFAGGAFVALHGSWHTPHVPPRVAFVPFRDAQPARAVDWSDPDAQWREFVGGFQAADESRAGRPTGVAVGPEGSLFVADDQAGVVYRIRPAR
jgi:glucose/arabinose dehydrogenase